MGAGGWHELDSWPPPSTETRYYLHRHDDAQTTTDPGLSSEMPLEPLPADRYTYDPDDPTPSIGGPVMSVSAGRVDNTGLESRSDVLTYTSALLEESLEVIGNVSLRLFTKSSVEHCDYFARLLDVHPDGKSINICDGLARVKPGSGGLLPDGSRMIEIDMWATAVKFQVGHRIRLMVSSGAHPRYYRNLGSDESLTTTTKIVRSEHSIYHDPDHRSCLLLPVTSS
jgi:putative CocE/NonD family hydrolase